MGWRPLRLALVVVLLLVGAACADGNGDDDMGTAPDGDEEAPTRLAYLSRSGDPARLLVTSLSGEDETVVAERADTARGYDWSPDGTEIVYSRFLDDPPGASELVIANADGLDERVLTSAGADDRYPVFSPDGERIAFRRGPARQQGSGLHVINRDGSGEQQLVDDPDAETLFPVWSPDGTRIAYERFPIGGEPQIAVIDADGGEVDVIAPRAVLPAWSPDGDVIAFVSSQAPGRTGTDLHTIRPDGSDLRQLAADAAGRPSWSPDGGLIAFAKQSTDRNRTDLAVVTRAGTRERVLADLRPHDGSPTWSPDGATIAFIAAEIEGRTDVFTIGLDDDEPRAVTTTGDAESPLFSPS